MSDLRWTNRQLILYCLVKCVNKINIQIEDITQKAPTL